MLKEAQNSSPTLRLLMASIVLGFSASTLVVLTVSLAFIPLRYYLPSVAEPLMSFLDNSTQWLGLTINFLWATFNLILTLLLRFILLGTIVVAFVLFVRPPKRLIAWGASEEFSAFTVLNKRPVDIILTIYYLMITLSGLIGFLTIFFESLASVLGYISPIAVEVILATSIVFRVAHPLLINLWGYGCKLAYPVLNSSADE